MTQRPQRVLGAADLIIGLCLLCLLCCVDYFEIVCFVFVAFT